LVSLKGIEANPDTIVGDSSNGPLMSYDPSLLWAISATAHVPRAL
jgi:hypothetical protein